jgi:predicted MFS family arabinose efflux permease
MLASASRSIGRGWAFALHEALDQTGAVTGPLVMSFVLASKRPYSEAFAILLVPALLALAVLLAARIIYPHPHRLDPTPEPPEKAEVRGPFRLYLVAAALVAAGYADFALIAYHFQNTGMLADSSIPLLYAGAMGVDALAALFMGRRYDQHGLRALLLPIAVSSLFAPLVFSTQPGLAVVGLACWAVGLGAQESIMRAAVADLVPADRRATGYGIFHGAYGLAWFAGSAVMGSLYAHSLRLLMAFSVLLQLAALPLIVKVGRQQKDIG